MKNYKTIIISFIVFSVLLFVIAQRYERREFDRELQYKTEIDNLKFYYELEISDLNDSIITLQNQNL